MHPLSGLVFSVFSLPSSYGPLNFDLWFFRSVKRQIIDQGVSFPEWRRPGPALGWKPEKIRQLTAGHSKYRKAPFGTFLRAPADHLNVPLISVSLLPCKEGDALKIIPILLKGKHSSEKRSYGFKIKITAGKCQPGIRPGSAGLTCPHSHPFGCEIILSCCRSCLCSGVVLNKSSTEAVLWTAKLREVLRHGLGAGAQKALKGTQPPLQPSLRREHGCSSPLLVLTGEQGRDPSQGLRGLGGLPRPPVTFLDLQKAGTENILQSAWRKHANLLNWSILETPALPWPERASSSTRGETGSTCHKLRARERARQGAREEACCTGAHDKLRLISQETTERRTCLHYIWGRIRKRNQPHCREKGSTPYPSLLTPKSFLGLGQEMIWLFWKTHAIWLFLETAWTLGCLSLRSTPLSFSCVALEKSLHLLGPLLCHPQNVDHNGSHLTGEGRSWKIKSVNTCNTLRTLPEI